MERIENLDVRVFRAQGIVGADATIRICIAWSRPAVSRPITSAGCTHAIAFFLPVKVLSRCFAASSCRLKRLSAKATAVSRQLKALAEQKGLPCLPAAAVPSGLGGLRQAALRRARTCPALSGPLHASRRHLQPPDRQLCRRQGHLPLERLRPREQATADDQSPPRSFCGGFCSTPCLVVLSASASADSWQTGAAGPFASLPATAGHLTHYRIRRRKQRPTPDFVAWLCPHCGGTMMLIEKLTASTAPLEIRWAGELL